MIGGQQTGPLSPSDFDTHIRNGEITERTHVWRDGMANWLRAIEVDELKSHFAPPPPPEPPPRPPPTVNAGPRSTAGALLASSGGPTVRGAPAYDDDNVPTKMGPKPDLKALFAEEGQGNNGHTDTTLPPGSDFNGAVANGRNGASHNDFGGDGEPAVSARRTGSTRSNSGPSELGDPFLDFNNDGPGKGPSQSQNLADLVGDFDSNSDEHQTGAAPVSVSARPATVDPFASVPDAPGVKAPIIGEQTRFFMKKAGVTNRNPWWKYAIFVLVVLGLPASGIYALGQTHYGGDVAIIDANGEVQEVGKYSWQSLADQAGLGEKLLGLHKATPEAIEKARHKNPQTTPQKGPKPGVDEVVDNRAKPDAGLSAEEAKKVQEMYGQIGNDVGQHGPKDRSPKENKQNDVDQGSLSADQINKVVSDTTPAFNKCVEDELRHNPDWKGGKVKITLHIKPSGTVSQPSIDKPAVDSSTVGECIKSRAKRMVFPRFDGDAEQPVEFDLVLANGG
jgi:hypothetical protein